MNPSHELEIAITAAQEAGKIHMKYFQKPLQKTMKENGRYADFATQADFEAETLITRLLQKEFPDDGILAEENGTTNGKNNRRWIVDPLDGTIIFARGIPFFGVMIALEEKNRLELGVIYYPATHTTLYAERGKGSYRDEKKIHFSNTHKLDESLLGYNSVRYLLNEFPRPLSNLLNAVHWRLGLPWLTGLQLASQGNIDIYLGSYQQGARKVMEPWDIAAQKIIAEEAGGKVSNNEGKTRLDELDSLVMANPILHQQVMQILNEEKP